MLLLLLVRVVVVVSLALRHVLFLSRSVVLEPHLRHPLTEARDLCDPLQVLPVRVGVDLEVGLKHLQLLVREGGPHPLTLGLAAAVTLWP